MSVDERIRQVDRVLNNAAVSLSALTADDLKLAHQLCEHFDLQLGTLIRRAEAIRILGGTETTTERLQEAAQHLIYR